MLFIKTYPILFALIIAGLVWGLLIIYWELTFTEKFYREHWYCPGNIGGSPYIKKSEEEIKRDVITRRIKTYKL